MDLWSILSPTRSSLSTLPNELLLHLAGYLSQHDLDSLVKAGPRNRSLRKLKELTFGSRNFAPWRRRWEMFLRAREGGMREARERAEHQAEGPEPGVTLAAAIVSSGQVLHEGTKGEKEHGFEAVMSSSFADFGFHTLPVVAAFSPATSAKREKKRMRIMPVTLQFPIVEEGMVFIAIRKVFEAPAEKRGYLRLKKLGCEMDALRRELEMLTNVTVRCVQKIIPGCGLGEGPEVEQCYRLLTAYLFFTALTPEQVPRLVLRATPEARREALADERHRAILEYFCFLGLWLDLWEAQVGMVRHPHGSVAPPVRGIFDAQSRRVLAGRLKEFTRAVFAPGKPIMGKATATGRKEALTPVKRPAPYHMPGTSTPTPGRSGLQRNLSQGFDEAHNKFDSPSSTPSTSMLTEEQQRVVDTDIGRGQLMKVRAYAGTGKTRSLVEYAKRRPGTKFLYVVFGKNADTDAKTKFGPNVECLSPYLSSAVNMAIYISTMVAYGFKARRFTPWHSGCSNTTRRTSPMRKIKPCQFVATGVIKRLWTCSNSTTKK
jgi:hypothetical protein